MAELSVIPPSVDQTGQRLRRVAAQALDVRGHLAALRDAGAATGDGQTAAAFARMLEASSTQMGALGDRLDALGGEASEGAAEYQAADAAGMSGGGSW